MPALYARFVCPHLRWKASLTTLQRGSGERETLKSFPSMSHEGVND
jgi:hypothetical protein